MAVSAKLVVSKMLNYSGSSHPPDINNSINNGGHSPTSKLNFPEIYRQNTQPSAAEILDSIQVSIDIALAVIDVVWKGSKVSFVFTSTNPAYRQLMQLPENLSGGQPVVLVLPADQADHLCRHYEQCVRTKKRIHYKESHGEDCWETKITPLCNPRGQVYRLISTSHNISEQKRTEQALRRSESQYRQQVEELTALVKQLQATQAQLVQTEKMSSLGQLVAGIAHEINNPINFIYGNLSHATRYVEDLLWLVDLYTTTYPQPPQELQVALAEVDLPFTTSDLLRVMQSMTVGAERIRQIVLSLRNFSRLDEDGLKATNLHEGLDSALFLLQHRCLAQGDRPAVNIILDYGQLPSIECYPGQINQVFMNLLINALDALEQRWQEGDHDFSPTIWISTKLFQSKSRVGVIIRDNGIGVSPQILPRLYDPFFTTKQVGRGMGLGLAISYQVVVEKHKGTLQCNSLPGRGAEFQIELPIFRRC